MSRSEFSSDFKKSETDTFKNGEGTIIIKQTSRKAILEEMVEFWEEEVRREGKWRGERRSEVRREMNQWMKVKWKGREGNGGKHFEDGKRKRYESVYGREMEKEKRCKDRIRK